MQLQSNEQTGSMTDNLRRMADEIRVRIHLAGMEAKEAWAKLEPKLQAFEHKAGAAKDKLVDGLDKMGDELKEQMARLLARLEGKDN
jgi:hypothetical protein